MKMVDLVLRMHRKILMVGVALLLFTSVNALAGTYYIYDDWGGTWSDVNKTGNDDSLLCWAAASSNILTYTGWGSAKADSSADLFDYFKASFSDAGGLENYAYEWWFSGNYIRQGDEGWAQVTDTAAGAFYPNLDIDDYLRSAQEGGDGFSQALSLIEQYMKDGYGVSIGIYNALYGGHSVTAWGFSYDDQGNYTGIYLTDSDDGVLDLEYYALSYNIEDSFWYLGEENGYYDNSADYISNVVGLKIMSAVPVPSITAVEFLWTVADHRRNNQAQKKQLKSQSISKTYQHSAIY